MNPVPLTRRRFGASILGAAGAALAARAVDPFHRPGAARLRLGLAAYSFRDHFVVPKNAPAGTAPRMDMPRFLDYCADNGCDGAELTSYYFPGDADDAYFAAVRRHAHVRGVTITGTAVGNTFTHPPGPEREREVALVKTWIARAAVLGAPHIRVFAGEAHGQPLAEAKRHCIGALEECAAEAGRHGIFLGIENHGGIVAEADDLIDIVRSVRSPWVGINLDTGNFHTEDPYADLARCAPYAVNVQYKGYIRPRGARAQGAADIGRTFRILREAHYQGWVTLEYEFGEDPFVRVPAMLRQMREFMG